MSAAADRSCGRRAAAVRDCGTISRQASSKPPESADVVKQIRELNLPSDKCVFSIDVEEWFHIMDLPSAPGLHEWPGLRSTVERNFLTLLDMLQERGVQATCFFLAWVAERHPRLVREAVARGHEVASHGYAHELVYELTPQRFLDDVVRAKRLLEDVARKPVRGYRAPGFSVNATTPWFFEKLAEAGYAYSSSIFPAARQHGGMAEFGRSPCEVTTDAGAIREVPITVADVLGRSLCFFGGGYLRLFPYALVRRMAHRVMLEKRPVVFYIHPREIDPSHPRLAMPLARRFKTYVGLTGAKEKVGRLLAEFRFTSFERLLALN